MKSSTTRVPERTTNDEIKPRKLFDIIGIVCYLNSLGGNGVTVSFVRTLLNSGQIPRLKIGRRFYATRESLDQWLERSQKRPAR